MMATVINVCGGAGDVEGARRYLDRLLDPTLARCVASLVLPCLPYCNIPSTMRHEIVSGKNELLSGISRRVGRCVNGAVGVR
jgi:pentatricopeptide repeat protein